MRGFWLLLARISLEVHRKSVVGAALGIRRVLGESHSSRGVRLMAVRCPLDAWSAGIAFLMAGLCDEFLCKRLCVFPGYFFFFGFSVYEGTTTAKKLCDFFFS